MDTRQKIAQLVIARLDGRDIKRKFSYYHSLVKQGIGGFIIFGGKARDVRDGIRKLQDSADIPLFISSDLERGLGQQLEGGTLFPHAMAIANAVNRKKKDDVALLRRSIKVIAEEAKAVGINTIFSPVMDVNSNPQNPIICTRAFSDDPEEAGWFGREFIKCLQKEGIIACAKHFPGHGHTAKDSHRELPIVRADARRLNKIELSPFKAAVKARVRMMMLGHLKVPAIDPVSPSSLSQKTITGLLKKKMGYKGLVITDAMNMQAVSGKTIKSEGDACIKALLAGADIILHPSDPEALVEHLVDNHEKIRERAEDSCKKVLRAKRGFSRVPLQSIRSVGKKENLQTAYKLAKKSIGDITVNIAPDEKISLLIIDDDDAMSGKEFIKSIKGRLKNIAVYRLDNQSNKLPASIKNTILIAAVFSSIAAWKGRSGLSTGFMDQLKRSIKSSKYSVIIGFCSPYILDNIEAEVIIKACSDTEMSQQAAGEMFSNMKFKLI